MFVFEQLMVPGGMCQWRPSRQRNGGMSVQANQRLAELHARERVGAAVASADGLGAIARDGCQHGDQSSGTEWPFGCVISAS